jgi:hypothetical protein
MDKQQIISFITTQLEQGKISSDELVAIAHGARHPGSDSISAANPSKNISASWNMINTLYGIGTIIGIIGVSILVGQHWTEIGFAGRIGVTLGISLISYIIAVFLSRSPQQMLSQTLFIISAVLAPLGVYVLLTKLDLTFSSLNQAAAALALFVIFAVAQYIARTNVLVVLLTAFGTWAYYSLLVYAFSFTFYQGDLFKWATIILGFAYILIAFGYGRKTVTTAAVNVLYGFGTLAILGAGISLGGIWDFVYILFIFAAFYGSVYVKSQSMLILGALFLMAHVLKLTYRFFLGSLGWPIALIISGFCIIVIGYLTLRVNQRYLGKRT